MCCLKANSEKLAVTLWVNVDAETGIIDYSSAKYEKTIINNQAALTYAKADSLIKATESED